MSTVIKMSVTALDNKHWKQLHQQLGELDFIHSRIDEASRYARMMLQCILDFDQDLQNNRCTIAEYNYKASKYIDIDIWDPEKLCFIVQIYLYYK